MKCPYRDFQKCLIEECPSCNYEVIKDTRINGRAPCWMSTAEALKQGCKWEETVTTYKFISCKLIDSGVQPAPTTKQIVHNTTKTNVVLRKSIF